MFTWKSTEAHHNQHRHNNYNYNKIWEQKSVKGGHYSQQSQDIKDH
jgi:hypothetical protein